MSKSKSKNTTKVSQSKKETTLNTEGFLPTSGSDFWLVDGRERWDDCFDYQEYCEMVDSTPVGVHDQFVPRRARAERRFHEQNYDSEMDANQFKFAYVKKKTNRATFFVTHEGLDGTFGFWCPNKICDYWVSDYKYDRGGVVTILIDDFQPKVIEWE